MANNMRKDTAIFSNTKYYLFISAAVIIGGKAKGNIGKNIRLKTAGKKRK